MTPMGDSGQRATSSVRVLAFRVSRLLRTRHTGRCWTTMLGRGECRAPHARVANQFGRTRYSASAALRSKRPAPSPAEPTRNGGNWRIPMSALFRQCAVKRFRNWFRPKPRVFSWFSPKENHSSRSLSGHSNCETALRFSPKDLGSQTGEPSWLLPAIRKVRNDEGKNYGNDSAGYGWRDARALR